MKSVPIVNTLEDLYDMNHISIASFSGEITRLSKYNEYPDGFIEKLENWSKEYMDRKKFIFKRDYKNFDLLIDIIKGKTILLMDSGRLRVYSN